MTQPQWQIDRDNRQSKYVADAEWYCERVLSGDIPACKWVKLACQRQRNDLAKWPANTQEGARARGDKYWFDWRAAGRIVDFLAHSDHIKGRKFAGNKIKPEPWQCFSLTTIYGWRRTDDGMRRFRLAYNEMPRKNAKTTMAAPLMNAALTIDGEPGAEVYSIATARDQARIVFDVARNMMGRYSAEFLYKHQIDIQLHKVENRSTAGIMQPLASDEDSLDGKNVSFVVVDELHAHKSRGAWDSIETATGARSQPLIYVITTAGVNQSGICFEVRAYACRVLEGLEDDTVFAIIYTIDEGDNWEDEAVWSKANPNYGISVDPDDMRRNAQKARFSPASKANFFTKRLCVWTTGGEGWLDMDRWRLVADTSLRMEEFRGWDLYMGLDLASRKDIAALAFLFKKQKLYRLFGKYYLPQATVDERLNDQYTGWAASNILTVTPGDATDLSIIEHDILETARRFGCRAVAVDPYQDKMLVMNLVKAGMKDKVVELPQSYATFSATMGAFEQAMLSGELKHPGCPAATWMIGNVVPKRDWKDNIMPDKTKPENKIDFAVASLLAFHRAQVDEKKAGSMYSKPGGRIVI